MTVVSLTAAVVSFLEANNTTTSGNDLSEGLAGRVKIIRQGMRGAHQNTPDPLASYPMVYVELSETAHEFEQLGRQSRRKVNFGYALVGITQSKAGGAEQTGREDADKESIQLASNIQGIIQQNITLSNTVDMVSVGSTDYNASTSENTYNAISTVLMSGSMRTS